MEPSHEPFGRDALSALVVEELVSEPHREAFAGRVVLTAVVGELVPDWFVLAADLGPSGPAIADLAVGVDRRASARCQCRTRLE